MGKTLGILALVFGLVSLALSLLIFTGWGIFTSIFISIIITPGLAVAGIVCGAIGISKDDKAGKAIAGLALSSIAIIILIMNFFPGLF